MSHDYQPAVDIWGWLGPLLIYPMKDRGEDSPGFGQLVCSDKMHLTSAEHIQDQTLVSVWHFYPLQTKRHDVRQAYNESSFLGFLMVKKWVQEERERKFVAFPIYSE